MDRDIIIFLNHIGFSSKNIFLLYDYAKENKKEFSETLNLNFEEIKLFRRTTFKRITDNLKNIENILEKIEEKCEKLNVKITTFLDKDFPEQLKYIEDPPALLYMRGKDLNTKNAIGFVGSRKYTTYGKFCVEKFIDALSQYDFTIVSGMAYGIDGLSHKRAIENNLNTIAVLGNGIDVVYPMANAKIYMEILQNGTVISEYPFSMKATKYTFPHRNRIISGLSKSVVVCEAQEKSGSLITARLAAEQGREVFSIPGNINSLYSKGTNKLIRDGATPLLDVEDILSLYPDVKKESAKEICKSDELISSSEKEVLELIDRGIKDVDSICNKLNNDVFYINSILTMLELKGLIEKSSMSEFEISREL